MPCSFGLLPHPRSGTGGQPNGLLQVTVADRYIPLLTAAYGTWVVRPARTTRPQPCGDGSELNRRVRPVLGDHRLVGKSLEGSRQPTGGTRGRFLCLSVAQLLGAVLRDLRFFYPSCPFVPPGIPE